MSEIFSTLDALFVGNKPGQIAAAIIAYVFLAALIMRTEFGKRIIRPIRLLFYLEPVFESSTAARRRLVELEHKIEILRKVVSGKNLDTQREAMKAELENQLAQELPALVKQKFEELKVIDASFEPSIKAAIATAVGSYFDKYDPKDIVSTQHERARIAERHERSKILEQTIEEQMRSAGRLKAVMINLFVVFNIGVLLIYLFAASNLSDRAVTAIIGLYVSLAAFIVYIYRTSNFRSSVLLALREDAKKYFDGDDYLKRLKPGASPSERDIEVLKLLLLNRSEREKRADHPYEVVLKGITNSNVQFKGGKIIPSSKSEK